MNKGEKCIASMIRRVLRVGRRRRHLLIGFLVISLIFIGLQVITIRRTSTPADLGYVTQSMPLEYLLVQHFMEVCHTHALPVFLIDPTLISAISLANGSAKICALCTGGRRLTSFGVLGQLWRPQENAFHDFATHGFSLLANLSLPNSEIPPSVVLSPPAPSASHAHSIPTHYVFHFGGDPRHYVHLVVFYRRGRGEFLWHATLGLGLGEGENGWMKEVKFGRTAGAYHSFDLAKVVVDGIRLRVPTPPATFLAQTHRAEFIECNITRATLFRAVHGAQEDGAKVGGFHEGARAVLGAAGGALDRLGVPFWISSGTCLGWFRQCDLIAYSGDVDIGIWIKDHNDRLIDAMEDSGLSLIHSFGKVTDSYELSFRLLDGSVKLDVFFFYDAPDYVWNGGTQARTGRKFKYIFPKFTLCWSELLDMKVRVPCETLSYVEANYGLDWFQPVRTWDWKQSPPNVRDNGVWPEDERHLVIRSYG